MADEKDTGLGLAGFLATPTQETTETVEQPVEVAEPDTPIVSEEQVEAKPEEVKAEVKEEVKDKSVWESEENTYKKRHADAAKWANQVNQQNLTLQRQLDIINKKLDGTYDAEAAARAEQVSPEVIASTSETVGRIVSSREAAYEIHGKEKVEANLFAENAPFKEIEHLPQVEMRILQSSSPVLEAMKVVEEYAFYKKWGANPKAIEENMKKAYEKEIEDRVTKKILEKVSLKDSQVRGLGDARSIVSGGTTAPTGTKPLSEIFGGR